jgi:Ion channel
MALDANFFGGAPASNRSVRRSKRRRATNRIGVAGAPEPERAGEKRLGMNAENTVTGIYAFLRTIVGRIAQSMDRRRMAILLATLVLLILARPIFDFASQARLLITVATVGFLLSCLHQVDAYPRLRRPSRLMVVIWLILNLPTPWSDEAWATSAASAILASLVLTVLWLVARRLVEAKRVDAELLCSAIGAYLLLGVFWAETYAMISMVAPTAFSAPGGMAPSRSDLIYFSFTTLTTTGYGDITAINPLVRMWSIFEAIVGTMYNATVVALLVSLYGRNIRRDDD